MAFGAGIGQAQQGLGQALERTGDMLQKHAMFLQDRANQAEATDRFVEWDKEAAGLQTWHRQQQGTNAVATLPELYKKQDELREKYVQSMPNIEVRRMFDQDSKRRLAYMIQDSGLYAANQNKQSNVRAANSRQSLAIQHAGNSLTDDEFLFNLESAQKGVEAESMELGWTPEETKVKREAVASKVYQSRIDTIAMTDPFRARDIYQANKEQILDPATRMHIEGNLLRQYNNVGTRYDADSIVNGTGFKNFPDIGGATHRDAIAAVESGGRYDVEGPIVTKGRFSGQRGIGKYQMMEDNVRDWTKEVLGKSLSPAEFKADKEAQDAVFDAKFGQLFEKYGNFQDAASAWHSGRSLAEAIKAGVSDGYSRTEDYVKRATAALGTGATGPLTTESDAGWLKGAIDRAKAIAQARAPDNPQYEDTLITRVKSEYSNVKTVKNAVDTENFMNVQQALNQVTEAGQPAITNPSQLLDNPSLNASFNALNPVKQKQILAQIERNARADVPLTNERQDRFEELWGMSNTDPAKFRELVVGEEDLPRAQRNRLFMRQQALVKNELNDSGFQRSLGSLAGMLNDAGIAPSITDKSRNALYNQFVGAFQTSREQWMKDNGGKTPTVEDNKRLAAALMTNAERPGRFFGTNTLQQFEVPSYEETKILEAYQTKLGRKPTPREVYDAYQRKMSSGQ